MGNITQKLDSIISARQNKLPLIEKAIENLEKCTKSIASIKHIKADLDSENSRFLGLLGSPEAGAKIQNISLVKFEQLADVYKNKLIQLKGRFSREQLHISLVGSARQGKSLVIQNISGLDKSIIPSSDGSDCTGTKSIITNSNNDDVNAEITFYNENEMIDIVNKYLKEITHSESYNVYSTSSISSIPIKAIKEEIGTKVDEQALATHLKNYIEHIDEIKGLLGKKITVPKEDIEKYVAQYKHDNFNEKYWYYLGVKTADIRCQFPYSEAGKIVLLDTIGIGTTSLGVESSMLDTVENDSDAIIFMFRPDPLGPRLSSTETDIINKISTRVSPEYAKEMLFWVINRVEEGKGRNIDHISAIREQIGEANFPVSEILEVNCIKQQDVEENLLTPVLNKMSSRIDYVDNLLLKKATVAGSELYDEFIKITNAFERGRISSISSDLKKGMFNDIQKTYKSLLNQLRDLYINKYGSLRNEPCIELKVASEETLNRMFTFIPKESELLELLNDGTINQHNALEICTNRIRLEVIDAFTELNRTLDILVSNMKKEVLNIFTNEQIGRLKLIEDDISNPENWIDRFVETINGESDYPIISSALKEFSLFKCSVQGFLIYEVRNNLDNIDFSLAKQTPKLINGLNDKEQLAKEIREKLLNEVEKVHNNVEIALNSLYKIPNRAMFAAIKDLYDRCSFEDRKSRSNIPVDHEWRYLYENWIPVIWKTQYQEKISAQSMAEEFNSVVDAIKECRNKSYFEINL